MYFFFNCNKACVRIRIRGEKVPELLLELQDDDRTQTFFIQVKSVQQQGKTAVIQIINTFNQSSKIYIQRVNYTAY